MAQQRNSGAQGSGRFDPYATGSVAYQRLLLTGMGLLGAGIVLAIIGGVGSWAGVSKAAIGLLAAGVAVHLIAQWTRFRQAMRERKARGGEPK